MNLAEALRALDQPAIPSTRKARPLSPADITAWALANGWQLLRNHPTQTRPNGRIMRLVMNDLKVRLETRVDHADGSHTWIRISSGFYKSLRLGADGQLEGMTR